MIIKHYGYISAACYRISGKNLVLISESHSEDDIKWPPVTSLSSDYTIKQGGRLSIGWIKAVSGSETRKIWPRGISFYVPVQGKSVTRIVFAVKNAAGKRTKYGELDGVFESMSSMISEFIDHGEIRHFVSEAMIREQIKKASYDLQILSDHEIRNPLTTVIGFSELLPEASHQELTEYKNMILAETKKALDALGKIQQILNFSNSAVQYDLDVLRSMNTEDLIHDVVKTTHEIMKELAPDMDFHLSVRKPDDHNFIIKARESIISHAFFEVIKNALMYSGHGQVNITLYSSDQWIVVDIEDDGAGVSHGAEELIFLRFFQEPYDRHFRKMKRGLGTGLYMARSIIELHGGSLKFIRSSGRKGIFRFMLPMASEESSDQPPEGPVIRDSESPADPGGERKK
ncbi:MAG: HAMP domain-containing histidine kinase [Deltaproteobacteria bacterium]|nr:HAMP domain-containing histidine kinase [Deltaproteobacteria bacterium]